MKKKKKRKRQGQTEGERRFSGDRREKKTKKQEDLGEEEPEKRACVLGREREDDCILCCSVWPAAGSVEYLRKERLYRNTSECDRKLENSTWRKCQGNSIRQRDYFGTLF